MLEKMMFLMFVVILNASSAAFGSGKYEKVALMSSVALSSAVMIAAAFQGGEHTNRNYLLYLFSFFVSLIFVTLLALFGRYVGRLVRGRL